MDTVKTRREEAVDATRAALLESALELFATRGVAGTSLDDVTRAARVTKGALYHHFPGGKLALFEAVFAHVDHLLAERTAAAVSPDAEGWELVEQALDGYLRACSDPVVRRIMFQEGPVALGFERWRELDGCDGRVLLDHFIEKLMDQGLIRRQPVAMLSRLMFTTLGEAGLTVAEAEDQDAARADAMQLLVLMLRGLAP